MTIKKRLFFSNILMIVIPVMLSLHIRLQFITEAMIISLVGGVIGLILGLLLGILGSSLIGVVPSFSLTTMLLTVLFSMAIGVFFGYYPANKAAQLDPIDALKYE